MKFKIIQCRTAQFSTLFLRFKRSDVMIIVQEEASEHRVTQAKHTLKYKLDMLDDEHDETAQMMHEWVSLMSSTVSTASKHTI